MATISYLYDGQRTGFNRQALAWIRRRARRIMNTYSLAVSGCSTDVRAQGIRIAVLAASEDWHSFNPQGARHD